MGGDLEAAPAGKAPSFLVAALKDPIGANLDRYQVVKGWVDAKGEMQEKVYDVAWSGDRKPGADGKVPSVGSTVDVANATWTNTIGAPSSSRSGSIQISIHPAGLLLRPGARNPNAALDGVRRKILQRENGARGPHADAGARLYLTHLVLAFEIAKARLRMSVMGH